LHNGKIPPGSRILVVGLGKTGKAATRFLVGKGFEVKVSEGGRAEGVDKEFRRWLAEKGVQHEFGGHSSAFFRQADIILVSPGVPLDLPLLKEAEARGAVIIGELALSRGYLAPPVIAVTGTNGKSTVTTLIGELLKRAGFRVFVGGNLGTPLAEYLEGPQDADWVVLEVSSFQLDSCGGFAPRIGVLLNITPDHLDRYPGFAAYAASKWRLFANQGTDDFAIVDGDDQVINELAAQQPPAGHLLFFGTAPGKKRSFAAWQAREERIAVTLPGENLEHYDLGGSVFAKEPNRRNAMAAVLAARLAGAAPEAVKEGLKRFAPLAHRCELVGEVNGVRFIDDSKATNIGAVKAALSGMEQEVVLIAGGLDKGGDYALMRPEVADRVKAMVLIGSAKEKMAEAFSDLTEVVLARDMAEAVRTAYAKANPNDVVLLAPACASFDMFESYAHRGRVFRREVGKLAAREKGLSGGGGGCPVVAALVA